MISVLSQELFIEYWRTCSDFWKNSEILTCGCSEKPLDVTVDVR